MSENRTSLDLITDIFGVLDRHGYSRGDTAHAARAILLISDLAHVYEGTLDHPFGPAIGEPPPQAAPDPPNPGAVVLPASQLSTIIAALDEASLYKRDRIETCADCADQSCGICQWRLQAAETYDSLATQLSQAAEAARAPAAGRPGPACQPPPAADREAGQ